MTDHWVANLLAPLAFWVLINGIDDLLIDIASIFSWLLRRTSSNTQYRSPDEFELNSVAPRHMAIFVAVWHEYKVIQRMIDNNVTRLNYPRFDFFVGAYPNDKLTIAAIEEAMKRYPNVHLSLSPHDGPTSKADNLNWIFQRMLLYEQQNGVRFDMILTHDAEDLMDPDALRWINYYAQAYLLALLSVRQLRPALQQWLQPPRVSSPAHRNEIENQFCIPHQATQLCAQQGLR
jgi:adsorption protein B